MNFYITISNGLIKDGHRQRMGTSVWEFMWFLDKITKVDEDGTGWVLAGKPIKLDELKKDLLTSTPKISANISKLKKQGYIETENTGHGLIIKVLKSKKRFNQKVKADFTKRENQNVEKVKPIYIDKTIDNTEDGKEINKEKSVTVVTSPQIKPPYSLLEEITHQDMEEIATHYGVPLSFVKSKYEDMCLWAGERPGNSKLKGRNWRLTLMAWVKRDGLKIMERSKGDPTKRSIDARHL